MFTPYGVKKSEVGLEYGSLEYGSYLLEFFIPKGAARQLITRIPYKLIILKALV